MSIERMQLPVGLKFDPQNEVHVSKALGTIEAKGHGKGWVIQSFDPSAGVLTLSRRSALTKVTKTAGKSDAYRVELTAGVKPSDGDQVAAQLESDPQHAGYFMTRFEPFLAEAVMTRLTPEERRARGAVATILGVKPWEVQVAPRPGGGFLLDLPALYVPSRHDEKLTEIAEVAIGTVGWYFRGDANKLKGEIVPSTPPRFPEIAPYPMELLPERTLGQIAPLPIGLALAERGDQENPVAYLDLGGSPHLQLGGVAGSGKSSLLSCIIGGALASGAELAIFDVPQKAVDFEAWRPFTRKGGWGAASFEENAVALQALYEEGSARAATFRAYGAKKLADLPPDMQAQMPPVLIVVDEFTGLLAKPTIPKALDQDHPLRVEAESRVLAIDLIDSYVNKIAAEMRFVGFQLVISTQVASVSTGIGTALRTNLTNKLLMGPRATDGNRKLVFRDPVSVPQVPEHIKTDPKSKGVGAAELEGQHPFVLKGFFATESALIEQLRARGVPSHREDQLDSLTRPDPAKVRELFPRLVEVQQMQAEEQRPQYGKDPRPLEAWEIGPDGKPLTGFARANAARHQLAVAAREQGGA